jgi:hypothetical protein
MRWVLSCGNRTCHKGFHGETGSKSYTQEAVLMVIIELVHHVFQNEEDRWAGHIPKMPEDLVGGQEFLFLEAKFFFNRLQDFFATGVYTPMGDVFFLPVGLLQGALNQGFDVFSNQFWHITTSE